MKTPKVSTLIGALLLSAFFQSAAAPPARAQTAGFASQAVDYTPGTGIGTALQNPNSALGKPGGSPGGSGTLNPFVANYESSELTGIGAGGQLTLALSNFVVVGPAGTREIGIYSNVFLLNSGTTGNPAAGSPATTYGARSVLISVSVDGINFLPLNGGSLITSNLSANYYNNPDTTNINAPPPANPAFADFGKPFTGTLSDFDGQSYAQIVGKLNGSAGGTWLDLSGTGLAQVGYVRFSEPAGGGVFYLNGVSLNTSLLGLAVPEPEAAVAVGLAVFGLALARGRRRKIAGAAAVLAAVVFLGHPGRASAQMFDFSSITNWTGSGPNQAALVIDWNDGKKNNQGQVAESLVWGYRFSGTTTGLDMFRAIDLADPRLVLFTSNYPGFGDIVYGIGYDLDGKGGTFTPGTIGDASTENGSASDARDHYAEGFNTKYWAYYINGNAASPYNTGGFWDYAQNGAGSQLVTNGSWNGYSISDATFNAPVPGLPLPADAVPEPSALFAAGIALAVVLAVHRRRAARG